MNPAEFLNTVYLGDRGCKSISIDGWNTCVSVHVDEISRIRSKTGNWEFYNDENIIDGRIVFTDVSAVEFDPSGPVPNDWIELVEVKPEGDRFVIFFSLGAVDQTGDSKEVTFRVTAKAVHLEDPSKPGVRITD
jgi:hypothetical protein